MQDDRLIALLRQGRADAPAAPKDEWFRVARRTVGAPRRRALAWGLGLGVAAGLAWVLLAVPRVGPLPLAGLAEPASSNEELRQDLEPLKAAMEAPAEAPPEERDETPGHEMLALLDAV